METCRRVCCSRSHVGGSALHAFAQPRGAGPRGSGPLRPAGHAGARDVRSDSEGTGTGGQLAVAWGGVLPGFPTLPRRRGLAADRGQTSPCRAQSLRSPALPGSPPRHGGCRPVLHQCDQWFLPASPLNKTPIKLWNSEVQRASRLVDTLTCWEGGTSRKGIKASTPIPCPTYLFYLTLSELYLYNKTMIKYSSSLSSVNYSNKLSNLKGEGMWELPIL